MTDLIVNTRNAKQSFNLGYFVKLPSYDFDASEFKAAVSALSFSAYPFYIA